MDKTRAPQKLRKVARRSSYKSPHRCTTCDAYLPDVETYLRHILKLHKMINSSTPQTTATDIPQSCEICDDILPDKKTYLIHLQQFHKRMIGKTTQDMSQDALLSCSRCQDRYWTHEGLERHMVMSHGLVTADLLQKSQIKKDGGRCQRCGKQYKFNMLQHLVDDHQMRLLSAEITYTCNVCSFECQSYQIWETHLSTNHPKSETKVASASNKEDWGWDKKSVARKKRKLED